MPVTAFTAATASVLTASRRPRTQLQVKKRPYRPFVKKSRKRSELPNLFKSGYWQETIEAIADYDVYEWINQEMLWTAPPAELKLKGKVAEFSRSSQDRHAEYDPPAYRSVPLKTALRKGLVPPYPLDEDDSHSLPDAITDVLASHGHGVEALKDIDIVTSLEALELLLLFVDRRLPENMEARGQHTRRGREAELLELLRVGRLADPAGAESISLGASFSWTPSADSHHLATANRRTYDYAFQQIATGSALSNLTPTQRQVDRSRIDHQVLIFDLGSLRIMVQVPVPATVPAEDASDLEGEVVQMMTANSTNASAFWGRHLPSRYVMMLLGNVGFVARGVHNKGVVSVLQELTPDDLRLDRPELEEQASELLGQLEMLLQQIKEVANCPGAQARNVSVYYCDAEIVIATPRQEEDGTWDGLS